MKIRAIQTGICKGCGQRLLLNPDNGLCIICENDSLRQELEEHKLMLVQCRREKQELYNQLARERAKRGSE